jgi:hypothetical protein
MNWICNLKTHSETRDCSEDENFPQPQKLHRSHSVEHRTTLNSLLDKKPYTAVHCCSLPNTLNSLKSTKIQEEQGLAQVEVLSRFLNLFLLCFLLSSCFLFIVAYWFISNFSQACCYFSVSFLLFIFASSLWVVCQELNYKKVLNNVHSFPLLCFLLYHLCSFIDLSTLFPSCLLLLAFKC